MTVYIYTLSDPITEEIRYVGKCLNVKKRLNEHIHNFDKTHRSRWIQSVIKTGNKPIISVIEEIRESNDLDWQESERFWINYLRFLGCDLCNLDSGGNGGKKASDVTRAKISAALKGRKMPDGFGAKISAARTGIKTGPFSEKARLNMRMAHLGKPQSPEHTAASVAGRIGKKRGPHSEVTKAKIRASAVGRKFSIEHRHKISLARSAYFKNRKTLT